MKWIGGVVLGTPYGESNSTFTCKFICNKVLNVLLMGWKPMTRKHKASLCYLSKKMNFGVTQKKQDELEKRMAALGIREEDLQEKYIHGSGPGGQKINKTASCVYLRHVPTELDVKMQRERSQGLNRYYARKRLCELLEEKQLGSKSPAAIKAEKIRKQKQRRKRRSRQRSSPEE